MRLGALTAGHSGAVGVEFFTPRVSSSAAKAEPSSTPLPQSAPSQERIEDLEALQKLATELLSERNLEQVVQRVIDAARALTGAAFGAFFYNVTGTNGQSYALYALSGASRSDFEDFPMPRNTAVFGPTFEGAGTVRSDDILLDPRYGHNPPYHGMPKGHLPVRSYLAVSVKSPSGEVLGGLLFGHPAPGVFTHRSERLVGNIAGQAALAMENARLFAQAARDLAAAQSADIAVRRLALIAETSGEAIVAKDLQGVVTSWNRGAERIYGYTAEEMIGRSIFTVVPPELEGTERGILAAMSAGRTIEQLETQRRCKDGRVLDVSLTLSPLRDAQGRIIGISSIGRDITELKRAHAELQRSHQELESRVRERTASLQEAFEQMEEFSYTVSHDLRSPMRVVGSYAQILLDDYSAQLPEAARGYLQRIADNVGRMDRMSQGVLSYSRLSRQSLPRQRLSLAATIESILQTFPQLQPPGAAVEIGHLDDVVANEVALNQAISNLLQNATKFVAPGVRPRIRIWSKRAGPEVTLSIADNGIGIDPKVQSRLFRIFERAHPNLGYEGTGVGLAIVRRAVARMNGRVGVESDGVNGSRFWITLPAADFDRTPKADEGAAN